MGLLHPGQRRRGYIFTIFFLGFSGILEPVCIFQLFLYLFRSGKISKCFDFERNFQKVVKVVAIFESRESPGSRESRKTKQHPDSRSAASWKKFSCCVMPEQ